MTHRDAMKEGIHLAIDAMPKRMRPCDMALLFANFLISYDMDTDMAEISKEANKIIKIFVDDCDDEDLQMVSAIKDADHFLAKVQAETRS